MYTVDWASIGNPKKQVVKTNNSYEHLPGVPFN